MPDTSRDYEHDMSLIMAAIAQSVSETRSEEIWAECQEAGLDVEPIANQTRTVIENAVKSHKLRDLIAARKQYKACVTEIKDKKFNLPESIEEMQALLVNAFKMKPDLLSLVTVQCRDFKDLPKEDVVSILKQLQELGVLDKLRP